MFYSMCFTWTERGFQERRESVFWLVCFMWYELILWFPQWRKDFFVSPKYSLFFSAWFRQWMKYRSSSDHLFILLISVLVLQYFPFISFPVTQCFPFRHQLSSVRAPSLSFFYYDAMKLFFPKSLEKLSIAFVILCLCGTWSSYFLPSQIILLLFLRLVDHENLVAHCDHLMILNLGCLINIFFPKMVSLLASWNHISVAALLEKWMSHRMNIQSICCFLKASENYFLCLESFLCLTFFCFNYRTEKKEGELKSGQSRLK